MPYTSTGPAIWKSFAPTPKTKPSLLNSIAGDAIEFAKPVIGTIEPAPANLPILLYTLIAVKKIPININEILVTDAAASSLRPAPFRPSNINCPIKQIIPPTTNAFNILKAIGEFGVFLSTYSW